LPPQKIGDNPVVEQDIPPLDGVKYYLAVPQPGQTWQMAIYDLEAGRWRAIGINELQELASKY